jgi:hypothetical protein
MIVLHIDTFAPHVGEAFDVVLGEASAGLTLIEARPLPVAGVVSGLLRLPFSLLFRSASMIVLPQKIYRLKNAGLGALDIFLVPIARDGAGIVYEAVFN